MRCAGPVCGEALKDATKVTAGGAARPQLLAEALTDDAMHERPTDATAQLNSTTDFLLSARRSVGVRLILPVRC
jgi:hypothetical protein